MTPRPRAVESSRQEPGRASRVNERTRPVGVTSCSRVHRHARAVGPREREARDRLPTYESAGAGARRVKAGDVVFIPEGTVHSYQNTGEEPFEFLCIIPNKEDKITILDEAC